MKELILMIAESLVDRPDEVEVTEVRGDNTTVLELKVAKEDLGKVIGKRGRNISAIRTILFAINAKEGGKRAMLEIIDQNEQ